MFGRSAIARDNQPSREIKWLVTRHQNFGVEFLCDHLRARLLSWDHSPPGPRSPGSRRWKAVNRELERRAFSGSAAARRYGSLKVQFSQFQIKRDKTNQAILLPAFILEFSRMDRSCADIAEGDKPCVLIC